MKFILYILTILTFFSCKQKSKTTEISIEPEAMELNEKAVNLHMIFNKENTLKAIKLLDKATEIDPDYLLAHWNKYAFQNELNLKDKAFETLKILESLAPKNPELIVASGIYHENNGDIATATEKYKKADIIYESNLDTINTIGIEYSMLQLNRATNLIFLGQDVKGKEILTELQNNETDDAILEMIQSFLTLSRRDLLDLKMNQK